LPASDGGVALFTLKDTFDCIENILLYGPGIGQVLCRSLAGARVGL
jgi:hypothetical protein